jgi:acetyltransferase-like isoleucine patch superfamily enzyme
LLLKPKFWDYLLHRLKLYCTEFVRDYERSRSGTDWNRYRGDFHIVDYRYLKADPSSYIGPEVRIATPAGPCDQASGLYLGRQSGLGRRTTVELPAGAIIRIGDYSTIQNDSWILGDVQIGRYCLFAPGVFISSGDHYAMIHPTWIIRDQDRAVEQDPSLFHHRSSPVIIEDDCWIGRNVFIKRGTYIGKGAIIGANSAVTKDVAPYSIHGGTPNRQIGQRFPFVPPGRIDATDEKHWPYFYSGFGMRRSEWEQSLKHGVLQTEGSFRVVLRGGRFAELSVSGRVGGAVPEVRYRVRCNGILLGALTVSETVFRTGLAVRDELWAQMDRAPGPSVLCGFNTLAFDPEPPDRAQHSGKAKEQPTVGIASVSIV